MDPEHYDAGVEERVSNPHKFAGQITIRGPIRGRTTGPFYVIVDELGDNWAEAPMKDACFLGPVRGKKHWVQKQDWKQRERGGRRR